MGLRHSTQTEASLLEELQQDPTLTQRELASRVGMALGVTNAYLKRLAKKGFLKVSTLPRKRLKYFLTPKGVARKVQITYEYLYYSLRFHRLAREESRRLLERIRAGGGRRVRLLGAGDLAEVFCLEARGSGVEIVSVHDDARIGQRLLRHEIHSEAELKPSASAPVVYLKQEWIHHTPAALPPHTLTLFSA
ncbi:MAG: winged helix-turn-helix transcriptional regulator [Planctomycetes bacterium]|nr:winged helix-turn-helix transcriptional regulator [Planctomycetota bacterium]